jgi:hypothetical protein
LPKQQICLLDVKEFCTDEIDFSEGDVRLIDTSRFCDRKKAGGYQQEITTLEIDLQRLEDKLLDQLNMEYKGEDNESSIELELDRKDFYLMNILKNTNSTGNPHKMDDLAKILFEIRKESISFLFLHALQIDGWLNLTPRYLRDYDRICLDTDDSNKILKDIFKETRSMGQVIDIVVHPLYTYLLMGIIFPDKNLAIWRGNPEKIEEQGLGSNHSPEIVSILETYRSKRIKLKNIMNNCVNFEGLNKLRIELLNSILADLAER